MTNLEQAARALMEAVQRGPSAYKNLPSIKKAMVELDLILSNQGENPSSTTPDSPESPSPRRTSYLTETPQEPES